MDVVIILIVLFLLFGGGGGLYWGMGAGWGIGPIGLIIGGSHIANTSAIDVTTGNIGADNDPFSSISRAG